MPRRSSVPAWLLCARKAGRTHSAFQFGNPVQQSKRRRKEMTLSAAFFQEETNRELVFPLVGPGHAVMPAQMILVENRPHKPQSAW